MKKKSFIIIILIAIVLIISSTVSISASASASDTSASASDTSASASDIYKGESISNISMRNNKNLGTIVGKVLGIISYIGYSCAVIVLVYIGIKFVLATPDGKAELKKQLIPYTIGIIILVAGSAFAVIIGNLSKTYVK